MTANSAKRPRSVTVLLGLVLIFTGIQILRVWSAIASWNFLTKLPLSVPPAYFVVSGAVWTAIGAALFWALWRRETWAPRVTQYATMAFTVAYWGDKLFLQAKGPQSGNEPFDVLLTALLLAAVFTALAFPQARAYFGERHGETNQA